MIDKKVIETFVDIGITRGPLYKCDFSKYDFGGDKVYRDCVYNAYLDASRTFNYKGGNCNRNPAQDKNNDMAPLNLLAKNIKSYVLCGNPGLFDFESWRSQLEDSFQPVYNCEIRFGQSQKIINMTFKYLLLCYEKAIPANIEPQIFEPCHMPLDTYIFDWLFYETKERYEEWSYIDTNSYYELQDKIRELVKGSVLESEFIIWNKWRPTKVVNFKKNIKL